MTPTQRLRRAPRRPPALAQAQALALALAPALVLAGALLAPAAAGLAFSPALLGGGIVQSGDLGGWFIGGHLDLTGAPDVIVFARGDYLCVFTEFRNVAFSGNAVAFDSPGRCVGHGLSGNCACLFQPDQQFAVADLGPPGSGLDRVRMSYPAGSAGIALEGTVDPGDFQVR